MVTTDFQFGSLDTTVPLKMISKVLKSPVLHHHDKGHGKHILVLVEREPEAAALLTLTSWVKQLFPSFDLDVVSASCISVTDDEIRKAAIYKFYKRYSSPFESYVRPGKTVVVSLGYSLSAITLSSDLQVESFYDYIFNKTYFYAPRTGTYLFPIDGLGKLVKKSSLGTFLKDSSRVEFAKWQAAYIHQNWDRLCSPPARGRIVRRELQTAEDWQRFNRCCRRLLWSAGCPGTAEYRPQDLRSSSFVLGIGCLLCRVIQEGILRWGKCISDLLGDSKVELDQQRPNGHVEAFNRRACEDKGESTSCKKSEAEDDLPDCPVSFVEDTEAEDKDVDSGQKVDESFERDRVTVVCYLEGCYPSCSEGDASNYHYRCKEGWPAFQ